MMSHLQMSRKHQEEKRCSPPNHQQPGTGPGAVPAQPNHPDHQKEESRTPDPVAMVGGGPPLPPVSLQHDLAAAAAAVKPPTSIPGLPKPPLGFGPPMPNMGFPPMGAMPGFPGHRLPGLRYKLF